MIVLMLTKELRKILADGEENARVIDVELKTINTADNNRTVEFNIGCGALLVPWFNMSGNDLAWEDVVTPCIATIKCDDLNPDIFTIQSIRPVDSSENEVESTINTPHIAPSVEEDLQQSDEIQVYAESEDTGKDPDKKCPNCGGSKKPFEGCNYVPKKHQW